MLLHGAGADATQWIDIGLVAAVDRVAATGISSRPIVAIAPDLSAAGDAASLVFDTILPTVAERFGATTPVSISGISRGGGQALRAAFMQPDRFASVGLHSPAAGAHECCGALSWSAWLDVGDDDPLHDRAPALAAMIRAAGASVEEHYWPGGHDRPYWRRHLGEYLTFHACVQEGWW